MKRDEKMAIIADYCESVIYKSWTWDRLTDAERQAWGHVHLQPATIGRDKWAICEITAALYSAFLDGAGYMPTGWREPNESNTPKF